MKSIPLIRVNTFSPFLTFLERLGSPVERWLEEVKLSSLALDDPESLLPRHLAFSFLQKAAQAEGIENLGLLVGRETLIAHLGNFGRLLLGSFTLYDALTKLQKYAHIYNSEEQYWFEEGGSENSIGSAVLPEVINLHQADQAYFFMRHTGDATVLSPYASQYVLILMLELVSMAADKEWRPSEIYLQTRQIKNWSKSEFFAENKYQSGAGFNAVSFPRFFLSLPLRSTFSPNDLQEQKILESLHSSAPPKDLPGSLQRVLVPLLREGYPDIHLAAEISGMSVRTLQRRLEKDRLTYSRLVEKTRFHQAIHWLQESSVQIVDIAAELGYSAPSHFTRAFKRWTGLSPFEYRRLGKENQDFFASFNEQ